MSTTSIFDLANEWLRLDKVATETNLPAERYHQKPD